MAKGTNRQKISRLQLPIRLDRGLHSLLEKDAKANGRSLNAEIVRRLEQSYDIEERFGGPAMVEIVGLMAGAFTVGGKRGAEAIQHPDWTPAEWLRDPVCFEAAMAALFSALIEIKESKPELAKQKLTQLERRFAALAGRGFNVKRIQGGHQGTENET